MDGRPWLQRTMRKTSFLALYLFCLSAYATLLRGLSIRQAGHLGSHQIGVTVKYDPAYRYSRIPAAMSQETGVCSDVVIRAMRGQGIDSRRNFTRTWPRTFAKYPKRWGLTKATATLITAGSQPDDFLARRGYEMSPVKG